jgi:5,10-methenyltetrahydrofolate synthetase
MNSGITSEKKRLRVEFERLLGQKDFFDLIGRSSSLRGYFETFVQEIAGTLSGRCLVSFIPFSTEPQIQVEKESQDEPYRVAYVRVDDWSTRTMSSRLARRDLPGQWEDVEIPGGKRIFQPMEGQPRCTPEEVGVILVPGLAFGRNGARLGRGAGFYDRFLNAHPHALRAGVAFSDQVLDSLPEDPHDQRMDIVLTDAGMISMNSYGEWKKHGIMGSRAT